MQNNEIMEKLTKDGVLKQANAMLAQIQSMEQKLQIQHFKSEQDKKRQIDELTKDKNEEI